MSTRIRYEFKITESHFTCTSVHFLTEVVWRPNVLEIRGTSPRISWEFLFLFAVKGLQVWGHHVPKYYEVSSSRNSKNHFLFLAYQKKMVILKDWGNIKLLSYFFWGTRRRTAFFCSGVSWITGLCGECAPSAPGWTVPFLTCFRFKAYRA